MMGGFGLIVNEDISNNAGPRSGVSSFMLQSLKPLPPGIVRESAFLNDGELEKLGDC